ncbi:MAG: hypothetical protein R2681_15855 [Pyrinomonadaceae bacterium]
MTKHIAGILLFSFIVGISAVVAGLFYVAPQKTNYFSSYSDGEYCKRKKKRRHRHRKPRKPRLENVGPANFMVTDAVFDKNTGYLTTYHYVKDVQSLPERKAFVYHFFVKDEAGTQYLRSERVWTGLGSPRLVSSFDWLSELDKSQNVYVMSGFSMSEPEFNSSLAVPVLIKDNK